MLNVDTFFDLTATAVTNPATDLYWPTEIPEQNVTTSYYILSDVLKLICRDNTKDNKQWMLTPFGEKVRSWHS